MKIYKNTATLDGYDDGLTFTSDKSLADIVLMGSKPIVLDEFKNLKGIFRAGIGRDNVPVEEAQRRGISVRFPGDETVDLIFSETARFTCQLILRMLYSNIGTLDPWKKKSRTELTAKKLLVIGCGNIGRRVADNMQLFMQVECFDTMTNSLDELAKMLPEAHCVTLHIPNKPENVNFMDSERLALMMDGAVLVNTARGAIVNEDALLTEIEQGRLRAAFDVYWQEPYRGRLSQYHPDGFYMTPHVASTCNGFLEGCRRELDMLIKELKNA